MPFIPENNRALRGEKLAARPPVFFNDHKEAKADRAAPAIRTDSPRLGGTAYPGKWKLFLSPSLLRYGSAEPSELYNLEEDPQERHNLLPNAELQPLVRHLAAAASLHRAAGGHRLAEFATGPRETLDWTKKDAPVIPAGLFVQIEADQGRQLTRSTTGLGVAGGDSGAVDGGEAILILFQEDILIESAELVAGNGVVGGFYQVGDRSPLQVYCLDGDIDDKNQSGVLSDLGVLPRGERLRLDSDPHLGVEAPGSWRLQRLSIRRLPRQ